MASALITMARFPLLLLVVLALPCTGLAHRLDEYLQATLVTVEPGEVRLEINLTPGVAVAKHVLAVVDRNHDGVISTKEVTAYSELLKRDLVVRVDQRRVGLKLTGSNFPAPAELRTGWGIIQMQFSLAIGPLAAGTHRLSLDNRHLANMSVYLLNAAQPRSGSIQITRQTRNKNQSAGEIEFSIE